MSIQNSHSTTGGDYVHAQNKKLLSTSFHTCTLEGVCTAIISWESSDIHYAKRLASCNATDILHMCVCNIYRLHDYAKIQSSMIHCHRYVHTLWKHPKHPWWGKDPNLQNSLHLHIMHKIFKVVALVARHLHTYTMMEATKLIATLTHDELKTQSCSTHCKRHLHTHTKMGSNKAHCNTHTWWAKDPKL